MGKEGELRIEVDLDAENDRTPVASRPNKHKVFIKKTRQVNLTQLTSFLKGETEWVPECIDTINFLDHVLREQPSRNYTQIKKSFFQRGERRFDLGGGVEAFKGVFSSLRPVLNDRLERGLSINVDVANGTFWRSGPLGAIIGAVFGCNMPQFIQRVKEAKPQWRHSHMRKDLARFKRVGVTAHHNESKPSQWIIDEIVPEDAFEASFPDPDKPNKRVTVYQYYKDKYQKNLTRGLPVVRMTKKIRGSAVYLPIEFLKIEPNQRYNSKLSDTQTSQMIRFAVTLPAERRQAIEFGVKLLDWQNDPYLRQYGIKVNPSPSRVKARVLPSPVLHFGPVASKRSEERRVGKECPV